jgi:hypothetical protein
MCWRLYPAGMLTVYIVHRSVPNANPNTCYQCQPSVQGSTCKNLQLHFCCSQKCMSPFAKTEIDSSRNNKKSPQKVSPRKNGNILSAKNYQMELSPRKKSLYKVSPRKKRKATPCKNFTKIDFPQKYKKSPRKLSSCENGNILPAKITKGKYLPATILRARCLPAKTEINSPRKLPIQNNSCCQYITHYYFVCI